VAVLQVYYEELIFKLDALVCEKKASELDTSFFGEGLLGHGSVERSIQREIKRYFFAKSMGVKLRSAATKLADKSYGSSLSNRDLLVLFSLVGDTL